MAWGKAATASKSKAATTSKPKERCSECQGAGTVTPVERVPSRAGDPRGGALSGSKPIPCPRGCSKRGV